MIATIIHYCTNEYRFIRKLIEEASHFSKIILIPVCDRFFNGQPENRSLLDQTYRDCPDCQFIEFTYYQDRLYNPYIQGYSLEDREWGFFWHATSRYIGALFLPDDIEYVLFLDGDEIIDGRRFRAWLEKGEYLSFEAMRLSSYLYVGKPYLRAKPHFNLSLFLRKSALELCQMINQEDRLGIYNQVQGRKKEYLTDENNIPFIHHYSWVRTHGECLKKSETWAHRLDQNWKLWIDQMFQTDAIEYRSNLLGFQQDVDVTFERIEAFFDPLSISFSLNPSVASMKHPHVYSVDYPTVQHRRLDLLLKSLS
jgi:hypothetical protein